VALARAAVGPAGGNHATSSRYGGRTEQAPVDERS
jgi:hypothetical protein